MGERIFAIIGVAFVAALLAFQTPAAQAQAKAEIKTATTSPQLAWSKVPESERRVLSPLEKDWAQLPGIQQRRLLGAAKKYSSMTPIQQERFQDRLKEWAELTPAQRHVARDKYKNLSTLPPAKQHELREKWQAKNAQSGEPADEKPASAAK